MAHLDMATMIAAGCPVCGGSQFAGEHRPLCTEGHDEYAYKDALYAWQAEALTLRTRLAEAERAKETAFLDGRNFERRTLRAYLHLDPVEECWRK
ncbi:MAG TPA: hypothetical protein PLI83_02705 [Thermomonas sp.]|nr:hypothetical protein [Thermomonas sp.]